MADDLTPDQVRARRFDAARKGYDRAQVDAFLADVVDEMERLAAAVASSRRVSLDLGIDDQEALALELDRIGGEVHAILEAARSAAEGMRTRASSDADAWTGEARETSSRMLAEAVADSEAMRASAWDEGTSLLASATSQAKAIVAEARDDALFVRAEAEREALRLTGDARRDKEEIVRSARAEAEQMVESARIESEGVLAAAHQQADAAQERARALEDRRSELLAELEAARSAIGELEAEIDNRRQELEAPQPEPEPEIDERTHHTQDGGSVRIVSPSRFAPLRPVDAEELVAEVTALRSGRAIPSDAPAPVVEPPAPEAASISPPGDRVSASSRDATPPPPTALVADGGIDEESVVVIPGAGMATEVTEVEATADQAADVPAEPGPSEEVAPEVVEPPAVPYADEEAEATTEMPEVTSASEPASAPDRRDAAPAGPKADEIGSLFARLRDTADGAAPAAPERPAVVVADVEAPGGEPPTPPVSAPVEASAAPPLGTDAVEPAGGPGEGPSTLPLQNAALRTIKRTLVDLQNETLEHLRTDGDWMPAESFTDRFAEAFAVLAAEITGEEDDAAGRAFGADLFDALCSTIERTRSRGGGEREVAAATSKVFRTWRSDEAERRVSSTARDLAAVRPPVGSVRPAP